MEVIGASSGLTFCLETLSVDEIFNTGRRLNQGTYKNPSDVHPCIQRELYFNLLVKK